MSARRIWLLTGQALREAVHLRLGWVLAVAALLLVAGATVLREFNFGVEEARFLQNFTGGAVALFGTAQAILLTVTIFHGGLERGVPGLLFTRGVRRPEWLAACLLSVWVSLAWLALAAYFLLGLLLARHGHAISAPALAVACGASVLQLGLVACFALATCTVSRSPLLAATLALALTLAAHLAPIIAWAGSHGRPAARIAWTVLDCLLPNFSAVETGVAGARTVAYAGGYAVLYTLLACLVFARREI